MILSLAMPALAADQTEASTVVTLTVEETPASVPSSHSDDDDSTPVVNTPKYEASIPVGFSLDDGDYFQIGLTVNTLSERQELHVTIDYDRTFANDGYFYLFNTSDASQKIPCSVYRGYPTTDYWDVIADSGAALAATFTQGSGLSPDMYGALKIVTAGSASSAGTYSGTIYFTIEVVDF